MKDYTNLIETCSKVAEITQDEELKAAVSCAQEQCKPAATKTVAFLQMDGNTKKMLQLAATLLQEDALNKLGEKLALQAFCLSVEYSSKPALYRVNPEDCEEIAVEALDETEQITELLFTCPCEKLKDDICAKRYVFVNSIDSLDFWRMATDETRSLCLITNATMAMSLREKEWLSNVVLQHQFNRKNLVVFIDNMAILNTASDQLLVKQTVEEICSNLGVDAAVADSVESVAQHISAAMQGADAEEMRQNRVALHLLEQADEAARAITGTHFVDSQQAQKAIADIEKTRDRLLISGKVVAENFFEVRMNELKTETINSVRDYSNQLQENIIRKIKSIDVKNVEKMAGKVEPYIVKAWQYFGRELQVKVSPRMKAITESIMDMMTEEVNAVYAQLEDKNLEILKQSFAFDNSFAAFDFEGQDASPMQSLKKKTRQRIMCGVPIILVDPFISVFTIAGGIIMSAVEKKSTLEEFRASLLDKVQTACAQAEASVIEKVSQSYESVQQENAQRIISAYAQITDVLSEQIQAMMQEHEVLKEKCGILEQLQIENIQPMLAQLR